MKKLLSILTLGIAVIGLTACGNSKEKTKKEPANKTETLAKPKRSKYYFEDDVLKIRDLKIKIDDAKVIAAGEQGNEYGDKPVLAIWYDTTNLTDKEISPSTAWIAVFNAYQDNNKNQENKLNVAALPDQQFLDSQMQNIKKNGTAKNAIAYTLSDDHTPVTLKATKGVDGEALGQKTYKIK